MSDLTTAMARAADTLSESLAAPRASGSQTRYGTVVANNGSTLDVAMAGGTVTGVLMTTACCSAVAGDRVLLDVTGPLVTATGILANSDNGPYVKLLFEYVPWTALSGTVDGNGVSYMVAGGMVTLSASLYVTSNGMSVPAMPDRYKPKKPLYLPSYYYSSNNLMGAWVPNKESSYSKIYLYALGSSVGSLLDCSWSWPLNV